MRSRIKGSATQLNDAQQATVETVGRGTRHIAAAQGTTQLVRFATNIVLARLLTPDDFGIVAIALVVNMLLDQLKDLGTGSAIIQRETIDHRLLNSVFYLNVALGALLAALMYVSADQVASWLGDSHAQNAMRVFAAVTFVTSLSQIHHSLLRRDLRFGVIALITTVTAVVAALVSIVGALCGLTYWALVVGTAAAAVVDLIMVWSYDKWRPTLSANLAGLRSIWSYSSHLFVSNLTFLVLAQVDKIIISHFLGSSSLGTYTLAQRTVTGPASSVGSVVSEVTFPAYSRRQNEDAALRSGFLRSTRLVALVTFPALLGLAAVADPAVRVVFGSKWSELAPIVALLAPIAAVNSVTFNSSQLLLAKGRTDITYRWGLIVCGFFIVGELAGVHWGLTGVATAQLILTLILTPIGVQLAFRQIGLPFWTFIRALAPYGLSAVAMAVGAWAAVHVMSLLGRGSLVQLVAGVFVGAALYLGWMLVAKPSALADALLTLRRRHPETP